MKNLVIIAVIAVGGYLAWQNFPGLRDKITQAANEYGGWTEEARKNDPVGFLNHAKKELQTSIDKFEAVRGDLSTMKKDAETKLEGFVADQQNATELANQLKELYTTTNDAGSWPVTWNGKPYSEVDFKDQIAELLATRDNAAARQSEYADVIATIDGRRGELRDRISQSKMRIDQLTSQEAQLKVAKISDESTELLAQVNELVEGNGKLSEDPVRSLDELVAASDKTKAEEAKAGEASASDAKVDDFLNS